MGLRMLGSMLSSRAATCLARFAVVDTTVRPPLPPSTHALGLPLVAC
jgi:hypothetical protein